MSRGRSRYLSKLLENVWSRSIELELAESPFQHLDHELEGVAAMQILAYKA